MSVGPAVCQKRGRATSIDASRCVLVGLGSNLEDPQARVLAAAELLGARWSLSLSPLFSSAPVDCPPDAPRFVNAVALLHGLPDMSALEFLDVLLDIEAACGRRRHAGVRNAPRTLDLDLLLFGDAIIDVARLTVPHPRALTRAFVLKPAATLAPRLRWPGSDADIATHLARLPDSADVVRMVRPDGSLYPAVHFDAP